MLLHLLSTIGEDYTLSLWEYGLDDSYDAWSPEIFQTIQQSAKGNKIAQFESCKKVTLALKNKNVKAVEIVHTKKPDYVITYQWIWHGNLLQVVYVNKGTYGTESPKGENVLKTIQLY